MIINLPGILTNLLNAYSNAMTTATIIITISNDITLIVLSL